MINSRDHMGGTQTMQWFYYERGFDGAIRSKLSKEYPQTQGVEGRKRPIIAESIMSVPDGLSISEAEKFFLLSKGGSFVITS